MVRGLLAPLLVAALASCTASGTAVDGGIVESCGDGGPPPCYSNEDCPAAQRCTIPGNADPTISITCCLPGSRGSAEAGVPCNGMDDCQTAVCAYTPTGPLCSRACQTDKDCPPQLPSCVTVDAASRFCGLPP